MPYFLTPLLTREILDYAKIYKFTQTANKFEKICSDFKKICCNNTDNVTLFIISI